MAKDLFKQHIYMNVFFLRQDQEKKGFQDELLDHLCKSCKGDDQKAGL